MGLKPAWAVEDLLWCLSYLSIIVTKYQGQLPACVLKAPLIELDSHTLLLFLFRSRIFLRPFLFTSHRIGRGGSQPKNTTPFVPLRICLSFGTSHGYNIKSPSALFCFALYILYFFLPRSFPL